jgi:hypothetical protein
MNFIPTALIIFFPAGCLFIYDNSVTVVLIFLVVSQFLFVIYTVCTCFNDKCYSYIPLSLKFNNFMLEPKCWLFLEINDGFLKHPLAELVYNDIVFYFL